VNIGDRIRIARKAVGLSQEEVARRAGLSLKGMGEIERGDIEDPHISSLAKIARALGVPVEALIKEEEEVAVAGKAEASQATLFDGEAEEERRIAYLRAWRIFLEDQARDWRADGEEFLQDEEPNDAGALAWAVTNRRAVDTIRNKVLREFATGTYPPEDSSEYQELMAVCDAIDRATEITCEFMRHVVLELHERAKAQQTAADWSKVEDLEKVQERVLRLRAREEIREQTRAINREAG